MKKKLSYSFFFSFLIKGYNKIFSFFNVIGTVLLFSTIKRVDGYSNSCVALRVLFLISFAAIYNLLAFYEFSVGNRVKMFIV